MASLGRWSTVEQPLAAAERQVQFSSGWTNPSPKEIPPASAARLVSGLARHSSNVTTAGEWYRWLSRVTFLGPRLPGATTAAFKTSSRFKTAHVTYPMLAGTPACEKKMQDGGGKGSRRDRKE